MSAEDLISLARSLNKTITTAESCTGGLIAKTLTDIPGASAIFEFGFVTYSNGAKTQLLGVRAATLARFGAVSEEVAREMAQGAKAAAKADIALSVTGIAGPGGSEFKPEGRVCFALSSDDHTHSETVEFGPLGRSQTRNAACAYGISLIEATINGSTPRS